MFYDLHVKEKTKVSATNIFGNRLLTTLGVKIIGKNTSNTDYPAFNNVWDMINTKNTMRNPPKNNVPIKINVTQSTIEVSGRLYKDGGLSHDPNIGALSAISAVLRILEYQNKIIITNHGLEKGQVGKNNKFIRIAHKLGIELKGIKIPQISNGHQSYWHYDTTQEKLASILLALILENFTDAYPIYENHGGCERSYFLCEDNTYRAIEKYKKGEKENYKSGNTSSRISIPDLIICDKQNRLILNIEGKIYSKRRDGADDLKLYDYLEKNIIALCYPGYTISRGVTVFGGNDQAELEQYILFQLSETGKMRHNGNKLILQGINNLFKNESISTLVP